MVPDQNTFTIADLVRDEDNNVGIKEVSELLRFVFRLGVQSADALSDGKVTLADATKLWAVIPTIGAAFNGIASVPKELGNLTDEELDQLLDVAYEEIGDLDNDVLKMYITRAINIGVGLIRFISSLVDDIKNLRG
jgi:hypothetical protein